MQMYNVECDYQFQANIMLMIIIGVEIWQKLPDLDFQIGDLQIPYRYS